MKLNSVLNPPDNNDIVIVLIDADNKVVGTTYRYKKNKWVGVSTGTVTHDMPDNAVWFVSPLQPTYTEI